MLDDAYTRALPVWTGFFRSIDFTLVGCGGTGSFLAPMLARLMKVLQQKGVVVRTTFVDFDRVEAVNVPRQNFVEADLGKNKASVLATRYSLAYGLEIGAISVRFAPEMISPRWQTLSVVIGCVDNSSARKKLSQTLQVNDPHRPSVCWWLDCGNYGAGIPAGQVLLGTGDPFDGQLAFNNPQSPNVCLHLPSPALQHPPMLVPQTEELSTPSLSCAEIARRNEQNLFINQRVACSAIEYLAQLTLTKTLRRFATYFHATTGSERSLYTDPVTLSRYSRS